MNSLLLKFPDWMGGSNVSGLPTWAVSLMGLLTPLQSSAQDIAYILLAIFGLYAFIKAALHTSVEGSGAHIYGTLIRFAVVGMLVFFFRSMFSLMISIGSHLDAAVVEILRNSNALSGVSLADSNLGVVVGDITVKLFQAEFQLTGSAFKTSMARGDDIGFLAGTIGGTLISLLTPFLMIGPIVTIVGLYFLNILALGLSWVFGAPMLAVSVPQGNARFLTTLFTNVIKCLLLLPIYRIILAFYLILLHTLSYQDFMRSMMGSESTASLAAILTPLLLLVGIGQALITGGVTIVNGLIDHGLAHAYGSIAQGSAGAAGQVIRQLTFMRQAASAAYQMGSRSSADKGEQGGNYRP